VSRWRPLIIVALFLAAAAAAWLVLGRQARERTLSGYIEGDTLFLSSPIAGTVHTIFVVEGGRVAAGQQLFSIDPATLSAQGEQAKANTRAAQTQVTSAQANVDQAEAEVASEVAGADRARSDLNRLLATAREDRAAVAGKDLDAARAALRDANARVSAARQAAEARSAQVAAARAQTMQAQGGEREVQIRVNQLSPIAPAAARVEDVFFQQGEWVSANQPIVSLLPDDRVKVRFFVPEQEVARYVPGRSIRFACDGCPSGLNAVIRYVSPRPEFTPPIIFSRDSRDRLVFMVEAYPVHPASLQPGLPVDVEPLP
jgi:HlyD family secretion protein